MEAVKQSKLKTIITKKVIVNIYALATAHKHKQINYVQWKYIY